jgi:parallel beta-helix repeat protein
MMKNSRELKQLVILPLCAVYFFIGAVTVQAATYYVAKTGNDANGCATAQNIATPKLTINAGIACLTTAGDTIYIRAGTYVENIQADNLPASGTASARITIARYQNETVTMAPGGSSAFVFWFNSAGGNKNYITIDGLILDGTSTLAAPSYPAVIYLTGGDHNIFQNLEIKNSPGNGVLGGGIGHQFLNNIIHDNGQSTNYSNSNGMYFNLLNNSIVRGNVAYNNECFGIRIYDSDAAQGSANNNVIERNISRNNGAIGRGVGGINCGSQGGGFLIGNQGNVVQNNLVYHNTGIGIYFYKESLAAANLNNAAYNNTIYGNTADGIKVNTSNITDTQLINNLVVGNATQITNNGTSTVQISNHTTGVITDCTLSTSDFRLKSGAPCIDAGTTIATVTNDFVGVLRPQGGAYDIGAYEVGGTDPSLAPPQNLTIK